MSTNQPSPASCPRCGSPLENDAPEGLCPRCLAAINFGDNSLFTHDGNPLPTPPIEELAPHFPQLEILSCLGRGGMGVVYKARQISLDRLVALKLLAPEREKDPEFSARFAREAQALAKMSHPHIVTVHDFGQAGAFFYLIMEYVDGANLRQLLQAHKFTPEQALGVVPPLCDALQYAHDRGIVHRDIKPENLLMDRDGKLKVADFGLAKMLGTDSTGDERPVGTPSYMAPEQSGDPVNVDNRADIYSLGVVIYEMLTGELPGKNFQPPSAKAGVDSRLDEVVHRAMEQEPDQRYQQASILKTEVERITASPVSPGSQPVPPSPAPPSSSPAKIKASIEAPAIAMMVASALSLCGHLFVVAAGLLMLVGASGVSMAWMPRFFPGGNGGLGTAIVVLSAGWILISTVIHLVSLVGANRMRKLESYRWALASSIILIAGGVLSLPGVSASPFSGLMILGQLGTGIWGLVVLLRDEVKAAFKDPVPFSIGKSNLKIPAIGLMVTSAINILIIIFFSSLAFFTSPNMGSAERVVLGTLILLFGSLSVVMFIGAWKMFYLKSYSFAITGAVLALFTPPGFLLSFAFGIWSLILLLFDGQVKSSFNQEKNGVGSKKRWMVAAGIVAAGVVLMFAIPVTILISRSVSTSRSTRSVESNYMTSSPEVPQVISEPLLEIDPVAPSQWITADDLAARLEASSMIKDLTARDSSLAAIARDAASVGNAAIAKQTLEEIADIILQDETRKWVALQLCDRGRRKDAVEIASLIKDIGERDQTLAELSTRKRPEGKSLEFPGSEK